jgi:diacylglycerol kinase (ATP)
MDLLRSSIHRLGDQSKEVLKVFRTAFILNSNYNSNNNSDFPPPQDEFNYFGTEEICVTVSVLIVSYVILSMPCFIGRSNRGSGSSSGGASSYYNWSHTIKQLLHIRSIDELQNWWRQLKHERKSRQEQLKFNSKSWEKFLHEASAATLDEQGQQQQQTVRTRNGASKSTMHASASEGQFNITGAAADSSPPVPDLIERFYSSAQQNGITGSYLEGSEFRPETDHDRFVKAWESHIRFAQYRKLVLPPTCKLYRPSPVTYHTLFDRREIERNLHLLVDESTWRRILVFFRNMYDLFDKIIGKLLNKKSTEKFSVWMMNMFRYRIRKRRGLPVEEDEEEDDDSVATAGSSSTAGRRASSLRGGCSSTQHNELVTPVVTNKKEVTDVPPVTSVPLPDAPSLKDEEDHVTVSNAKNPQDNGRHVAFFSPMNSREAIVEERRDEAPFESVQHLFPPTVVDNHVTGEAAAMSNSERDQVKEVLDSVVKAIEGNETTNGGSSLLNVSIISELDEDGMQSSPARARFHTASHVEVIDDPSFVSTAEQNNESLTASLESTPLNNVSLVPVSMKKDTQDGNGDPTTSTLSIPALKPISIPDNLQSSGKVSPMPSPKLKRNNSFDDAANMIFFDTANSNRQLADMSRDVPLPDAGGYILGDEFLGSSCTPLLVFVNSRSGSQQGDLLITQFRRLLNPIQIWDLANGGPEKVLKSFSVLTRFQVLICGGDGTVSWIISALEKMDLKRWPPIGILPLGTGNDLARVHGWGGGYNNESLLYILKQISEAYISMLDLWELDITTVNKKGKVRKEEKSFLNYLGVGVDAQAALQVHNLRESKPKLFFSRFFNKAYYALAGGEEAIKNSCTNISEQITLVADGIEIPLPPDSQGIIFLNIDSYTGGVPMWSNGQKPRRRKARTKSEGNILHGGSKAFPRNDSIEDLTEYEAPKELSFEEKVASLTACDKPSSCQDGLLDVVSVRGAFHLGQIRVGLSNADLLCQCREATVTLKKRVAVQIDGEPWRQAQSTLRIIRKKDRATMLHRSVYANGGVESEVTKLLNWANEKEIIDRNQYAEIMGEFSRRVEFKKVKDKTKW